MADDLDLESQRREWSEMMAGTARADAAAERARRRDMFAAAALTGQLARPSTDGTAGEYASDAVAYADAMLAALDATAVPTSVSVPPAPVSRPPETRQTQRGGA